jgi:hypothetical protein
MKQKTAFRCLYYGFCMFIVTLMTVVMLDHLHIENYCDEQNELTFSKCLDVYHANYFYLILIGDGIGGFAVFILDLIFFLPFKKDDMPEELPRTFCINCGKFLSNGTLWCGTPTCIEIWREKEIDH